MLPIAVLTTTLPDMRSADELATFCVARQIAACAQLEAIQSVYVWDAKLMREAEVRVTLKTTVERGHELLQAIASRHPYEIPELLLQTQNASAAYADWVRKMTTRGE